MEIVKFKSRKVFIICSLLLIAILASSVVYIVENGDINRNSRKQLEAILKIPDTEIVAIVDGEKITRKGLNTYKLYFENDKNVSDGYLLEQIIETKAINDIAIKDNFFVSEELVNIVIKIAQETIKSDSRRYESFKERISELNISEDEYWEVVKPSYKKQATCGEYEADLKYKFMKENKLEEGKELDSKFKEFYKQKVNEAKSQIKVEYFLK